MIPIHASVSNYFNTLLCFLALGIPLSFGQIINIEEARKATDSTGFSGHWSFMGNYLDNKEKVWSIQTQTNIQYKGQNNYYWFITDWSTFRSESTNFQNILFLHLRHNYKFNEWWRLETFIQHQYNKIQRIDHRILLGVGPRIKLLDKKLGKIYLGSTFMPEWEDRDDQESTWRYQTRWSNYLSFTFNFWDHLTLRSTTYYQPSLQEWINYRLSHQKKLEIELNQFLSLVSSLRYTYDQFPILDAPKSTVQLVMGIKGKF